MKLNLFVAAAMLTIPSTVLAHDVVIATSPYQAAESAQTEVKQILQFVTSLEAGDTAVFVDGYNLKTIGIFKIPTEKLYASPKARLALNKAAVGELLNFAKNAAPNMSGNAPRVDHALRLPQLLRFVAQNRLGNQDVDLCILGSAFYDDQQDPAFSMADGLIPSDGHLLSSRAKTPFGTSDSPNALKGLRVHISYTDTIPSDQNAYFIERFLTLFIERQSGALVTFSSDKNTVFSRAKNKAEAPQHNFKIENNNKIEMFRLRTELIQGQPIYQRPLSSFKPSQNALQHAGQVEIGLSWDCLQCDIDLYAQASPNAQPIYFGNSKTSEGIHLKDFMQSPRAINGYETIEFSVPINLQHLKIVVNFYSGDAPHGVKGELRLAFDGNTYAMPISISATSGDKSESVRAAFQNNKSIAPQTLFINPLVILGVRNGA